MFVREAIRRKHYSKHTEEAYIYWIKRYIFFHNPVVSLSNLKRHPLEMGNAEVEPFLTDLATKRLVSASTQNQAFSALLFLACFSSGLMCYFQFHSPVYRVKHGFSQYIVSP